MRRRLTYVATSEEATDDEGHSETFIAVALIESLGLQSHSIDCVP